MQRSVRTRLRKGVSEAERVCVMVTTKAVGQGTGLTPDMLDFRQVTADEQPRGTIKFGDPDENAENRLVYEDKIAFLSGQKVTRDLEKSEILHTSDLEAPVGDSLGDIVKSGLRAVAVDVDSSSLFGGLLRPNDRVDVLATFPVGTTVITPDGEQEFGSDRTVVILEDIPVLAVGGRLDRGSSREGYRSSGNVVLALPMEKALPLTHLRKETKISLFVRSAADTGETGYAGTGVGVEAMAELVKTLRKAVGRAAAK